MGPKHRKQVKGQVTVDPNSKPLIHTLLHPISWVLHRLHALLTTILLAVLALGPMPHHIGFVMDGNRRYARLRGQKVAKGHQQGSESLKRVSCAKAGCRKCGERSCTDGGNTGTLLLPWSCIGAL